MRIRMPSITILASVLLLLLSASLILCEARKSPSNVGGSNSRSSGGSSMSSRRSNPASGSRRSSSSSSSRRKMEDLDDMTEEEDDSEFGYSDEVELSEEKVGSDSRCYDEEIGSDDGYDEDNYDEYEREPTTQRQRMPPPRSSHSRPTRRTTPSKTTTTTTTTNNNNNKTRPRTNRQSSSRTSRTTKPYRQPPPPPPSTFTRHLTTLRTKIPTTTSLRTTLTSATAATHALTTTLTREIKILSSSELEQAFLKATTPNDSPAKEKHVERLVMITYQVSAGYNIFEVVLRKLWNKMLEKDWRTVVKAVYVLHRFGTDGAVGQQMALKGMLREMRRTKDVKRKTKYFNMKQLLEGDSNPQNIMYRAFLARYAHYVLLRVQCFGGMFSEIDPPKSKPSHTTPKGKTSPPSTTTTTTTQPTKKPITSTRLKKECLDAAQVVLKAGIACTLKPTEECENTVVAMERVVSDMIGLTTAVASALNDALLLLGSGNNGDDDTANTTVDKQLIKRWCEFYADELLPQTKAMIKSATPTLDAFGIFLPSRMGTSVSRDLLQKGLVYKPPLAPTVVEVVEEGEEMSSSSSGGGGKEGEQDRGVTETEEGRGDEQEAKGDGGTSVGGRSGGDNYRVEEHADDTEEYDDEYEYDEYYDTDF